MKSLACVALGLLALAGCATIPERPPVADADAAWSARAQDLGALPAWELRGRVALRAGDDGAQASLVWLRQGEHHQLDFFGPLGRGHLRLTQNATGAELRDSDQRVLRNTSAEALLAQTTGWQLPLAGLRYWVLGLPDPNAAATPELDAWGRLKSLQQLGWDIRFLDYTQVATRELPGKVFLSRAAAGPGASALEVRLVIERWSFNSP